MNNIKKLREERGINQKVFADLIDVSLSSYSKKEKGSVRFSLQEAKILSEYLRLSIDEIFFES